MPVWAIIGIAVAAALIAWVLASVYTRRKDIKKVAYMMDALEDGELNFRFQDRNKFNRTLNRIRTIFEKQRQAHEQDSWTKLIRVLTHEIMNTVSPIASLSDAMAQSVDENGHSELDIKAGLETISDSSKNLIDFVQTYRQLSGVAKPIRKALDLQELMDSVIGLNREFIASNGAECVYSPEEPDFMIYADEGQISQILINLIKNRPAGGREAHRHQRPDGQGRRDGRPRGQRRRAHPGIGPGTDLHSFLYHQERGFRHRPQHLPADHAEPQRYHRTRP